MSIIINRYQRNFLVKYSFDPAVPYYKKEDFKGLKGTEDSFINKNFQEIRYFSYFYEPITHKKIILFLPGIGPGHKAYLREINEYAKAGYKVITLDYEGCGYSKGIRLPSIYQPTRDVLELLNIIGFKNEIVVVGHSLGAFTALNIVNKVTKIKKAVIISGFLNPKLGMMKFVKSSFIASRISNYEYSVNPDFKELDNLSYLKHTTDDIMFVHSIDDKSCGYKYIIPKISKFNNSHLSFYIEEHKRHNPTYTVEAVKYKDKIVNKYFDLVRKNIFKSIEEKKEYFKDVSLEKLTTPDEFVFDKITNFIG